jgi:hypothetical protein
MDMGKGEVVAREEGGDVVADVLGRDEGQLLLYCGWIVWVVVFIAAA